MFYNKALKNTPKFLLWINLYIDKQETMAASVDYARPTAQGYRPRITAPFTAESRDFLLVLFCYFISFDGEKIVEFG